MKKLKKLFIFEEITCFVPLQEKKPKTKISPPSADKGTECPGMLTTFPSSSNRPIRGPIRTHPTKAHTADMKTW